VTLGYLVTHFKQHGRTPLPRIDEVKRFILNYESGERKRIVRVSKTD